ncbi:MAG: hypothetical protein M0C28_37300 [Candidatus Moduliflexus flocculans]|nr:hypothetical protein [Candidatus Moduliflexus flocculans]
MTHGILMHEPDDDVGVAVADLAAGTDDRRHHPRREAGRDRDSSPTPCRWGTRSRCATSPRPAAT